MNENTESSGEVRSTNVFGYSYAFKRMKLARSFILYSKLFTHSTMWSQNCSESCDGRTELLVKSESPCWFCQAMKAQTWQWVALRHNNFDKLDQVSLRSHRALRCTCFWRKSPEGTGAWNRRWRWKHILARRNRTKRSGEQRKIIGSNTIYRRKRDGSAKARIEPRRS